MFVSELVVELQEVVSILCQSGDRSGLAPVPQDTRSRLRLKESPAVGTLGGTGSLARYVGGARCNGQRPAPGSPVRFSRPALA